MDHKPFLIIRGELVQKSAASFGGNGESSWVDHVLCRDGKGRYTLRGETLAGALAAKARRLFKKVPDLIGGNKELHKPSVWRMFTSHPVNEPYSEVRQNNRIHPQTGAAADGALFDSEMLPRGTRWPFILEIDLARCGEEVDDIVQVTLQALAEWIKGNCWLGRSVGRGAGWFELENIKVAELGWEQWPNSGVDNLSIYLDQITASDVQKLDDYLGRYTAAKQADGDWTWHDYKLTLQIGSMDDESYGIDFLSVGGHAGDALLLDIHDDLYVKERLLLPQSSLDETVIKHWLADQVFAYTRHDGQLMPFIPGSSLRGVLRHAAEWWAHKYSAETKLLENLFGLVTREAAKSGALLVSDAHLLDDDWQALLLNMHAEDEFAGGVYQSALFDRLLLTQGNFKARLVLEARKDEIEDLKRSLEPALHLAKTGLLGLGGQSWRGFGHLKWQFKVINSGGGGHE